MIRNRMVNVWILVASVGIYAEAANSQEIARQKYVDQVSSQPIDYVNSKPIGAFINITGNKEKQDLTKKIATVASLDFNEPNFIEPKYIGHSEKDVEILIPASATVVYPKLELSTKRYPAGAATQEFGVDGAIPYTTSRVNLSGKTISEIYPYSAAGRLTFNIRGQSAHCSASLISPGVIMTAAHCVVEYGVGDFYSDFEFVPAYHYGKAPYGRWQYEEVMVMQNFASGLSFCAYGYGIGCEDDVALLTLQSKSGANGLYPAGAKVGGWLGVGWNEFGFSGDLAQLTQLGYPASHDGGLDMQRTDAPGHINRDTSTIETASRQTEGSSGGPWVINFGELATLSDGVTYGQESDPNIVVGIASAGVSGAGREKIASMLTDSNFGALYNELCPPGSTELACAYEFPDTGFTPDGGVRISLEEPRNGGTYTGIGNIQGWAVYPYEIEEVAILVDGEYKFNAPYGGERLDVGDAFPNVPSSTNSGFAMAFAYTNLTPGQHTITAIARSITGDINKSESTFTVIKFDETFYGPAAVINPANSTVSTDASGVYVDNLFIDGRLYDVKLVWSTATQGFKIVKIQ